MSYIDDINNKSINNSTIEIRPDDKIMTLSTCSYETDNTRTAVHGKLVSTEKIN